MMIPLNQMREKSEWVIRLRENIPYSIHANAHIMRSVLNEDGSWTVISENFANGEPWRKAKSSKYCPMKPRTLSWAIDTLKNKWHETYFDGSLEIHIWNTKTGHAIPVEFLR